MNAGDLIRCEARDCYNAATHAFIGEGGEVHCCAAHAIPGMPVSTQLVREAIEDEHIYSSRCPVCRIDTRHPLIGSLLDEIDRLRARVLPDGTVTR